MTCQLQVKDKIDVPAFEQLRINDTDVLDSGLYVYDIQYGDGEVSTGAVFLYVHTIYAELDTKYIQTTRVTSVTDSLFPSISHINEKYSEYVTFEKLTLNTIFTIVVIIYKNNIVYCKFNT